MNAESRTPFAKTVLIALILAGGLALGVYRLGSAYADEATAYQKNLETLTSAVVKPDRIPADYVAEQPHGFLAKMMVKHRNNEVIKGLAFISDTDDFSKAHPNNEVVKAYSILTNPNDFIEQHPNNELARALQILTDTKGFYTGHPNNDLGKALHVMIDPTDFIEKHPHNELGKALQLARGDISGFKKAHPNNEITRAIDSVQHPNKRLKKIFGW